MTVEEQRCIKCKTLLVTDGTFSSSGLTINKVYCPACGWVKKNNELKPYVEDDGFFNLSDFQKK